MESKTSKQTQTKERKCKDVGFINVVDPNIKNELMTITNCPKDATNFTFWFSKVDKNNWGLTIKSIPPKSSDPAVNPGCKEPNFNSQHTWKITWYHDNGKLMVANHSKSLADNISASYYPTIENIFRVYHPAK